MAKQDGATEKATPKKRQKAREDGNVPQSKELTLFFSLFVFLILLFFGEWFVKELSLIFVYGLNLIQSEVQPLDYMVMMGGRVLKLLLPIATLTLVAMAVNYFVQVKFLFSLKAVAPKLTRLNPDNYRKKVFSRKTVIDTLRSFLVILVLGYVVYYVFRGDLRTLTGAMLLPWNQSLVLLWGIFKDVIIRIVCAFFVIATIDFVYQKWENEENLKMKKEDVKQENKEQNGSAEVKQKQREVMISVLKNEVMQKMPEATFTVTNPTHYAVAVRYKKGEGSPRVLVKGIDHLALFMKDISNEHNVPIVENPQLARELYQRCVENEDVPADMWTVVADVLHELLLTRQIKID
jgi:flagellar biosynthesis protein FlhB